MDIIEMTRELGRALQNDERYIAMMAARQASDEDEALQDKPGAVCSLFPVWHSLHQLFIGLRLTP